MKIIYECEKVVILQDDEKYLIHVLDNYRFVKEIQTNKENLFSILKKEFPDAEFKKSYIFGKKLNLKSNKQISEEKLLNFI